MAKTQELTRFTFDTFEKMIDPICDVDTFLTRITHRDDGSGNRVDRNRVRTAISDDRDGWHRKNWGPRLDQAEDEKQYYET